MRHPDLKEGSERFERRERKGPSFQGIITLHNFNMVVKLHNWIMLFLNSDNKSQDFRLKPFEECSEIDRSPIYSEHRKRV